MGSLQIILTAPLRALHGLLPWGPSPVTGLCFCLLGPGPGRRVLCFGGKQRNHTSQMAPRCHQGKKKYCFFFLLCNSK